MYNPTTLWASIARLEMEGTDRCLAIRNCEAEAEIDERREEDAVEEARVGGDTQSRDEVCTQLTEYGVLGPRG